MKAGWIAYMAAAGTLALGAGWTEVDAGLLRSAVQINALVPDPLSPATVYAVGRAAWESGSLFNSADGGVTWKILGGVSGVTSLAVDPGDSSTLYVIANGTVLKSVDGGQSWTNASAGVFSATSLAIDPQNGSVLYAGAQGGLFKTTDGAMSWQALGAPLSTLRNSNGTLASAPCCGQLAIDPSASSTIYVNNGIGLLKSVDGGATWRTLVSQGMCICALTIDPAHPSTIYTIFSDLPPGQLPNLHKSTDGGETWSLANTGIPAGAYVTSLAIDPTSGTLYAGYLVGDPTGGVVKSIDGAASWSATGLPSNGPSVYALALNPKDPSTVLAAYFDSSTGRGGVFKTTDGGANWDDASAGLAVLNVHALATDPANGSTLYVAAGDGISKSLDSGSNWTTVHFTPPDSPLNISGTAVIPSLLIDPTNSSVLYASVLNTGGCGYSSGFLRKSVDAGSSWNDLPVSDCASGPIVLFATTSSDSNTVYAAPEDIAACGTTLDTTNDGGATWNTTYIDGFVTALVADPAHPATLYAAYNQGLFKSADGGNWAATTLTNVNVSALALDPMNSSILYAGGAATSPDGAPVLFKSTDGGATWSSITAGLEPIVTARSPITALAIDSRHSVLYLGASGSGVFKSADGGATWTVFSEGLSNLDIRALAVSSDDTVYAGAGDGVFRSLGRVPLRSLPDR
jgi:photosystem II stability/assembly factor-like uncharacterized protein